MKKTFNIKIGNVSRDLKLCKINDDIYIAAFVLLGDEPLTRESAKELLTKAPKHDIIITAEAKGITLVHEMARISNAEKYVVARKNHKLYMQNALSVSVHSITTNFQQTLYIDDSDVALLKGKNVLIVDDVISTGESLLAIEKLVNKAGGNIVGKMAVLAEGAAAVRDDIIFLEPLPLFNNKGEKIN